MKPLRAVLAAALLAAALPCFADLCQACRGKAFTTDLGTCSECAGTTSSGAFKLCPACSRKLQQCQACRAALGPDRPIHAGTLDTTRSGTFAAGRWEYRFEVWGAGSESERMSGVLAFDGRPLPNPDTINDHVRTPWGVMFWVGDPRGGGDRPWFGPSRWMPRPGITRPLGRLLPDPAGQPQSLVLVQVIADSRNGIRPVQDWVVEELARRGVKDPALQKDWFAPGAEEVTLHDSKHYGQAGLKFAPTASGEALVVTVSGAALEGDRPAALEPPTPDGGKKPGRIEMPFRDGEKKLVKCTLSSSVATLDLYLAIRVEVSAAPAGGAEK